MKREESLFCCLHICQPALWGHNCLSLAYVWTLHFLNESQFCSLLVKKRPFLLLDGGDEKKGSQTESHQNDWWWWHLTFFTQTKQQSGKLGNIRLRQSFKSLLLLDFYHMILSVLRLKNVLFTLVSPSSLLITALFSASPLFLPSTPIALHASFHNFQKKKERSSLLKGTLFSIASKWATFRTRFSLPCFFSRAPFF